MHSALLVDELLREVFSLCRSHDQHRKTLVQLARCCQAWREPALREAWEALPCITPFLKLITVNTAPSEKLGDYARMVKHVRLGTKIEVGIALGVLSYDTTPPLPNLESVAVLMDGCAAPAVHLLLSPMLSTVTIDIGVSTGRATGVERSGNIAAYLSSIRSSSIPIQKLSIRGFACENLNQAVSSLSTLKSLSLKVGTSLSTTAVTHIASFPFLEELLIHADRVDADSLKESLSTSSAPVFPNLQTFDIRSSAKVAATFLQHLKSTTFTRFSIEVTQEDDSIWTHLYSVIPTTVQEIHVDYHTALDEPTADTSDTTYHNPFSIGKLGALSRLTALRAFALDTNILVDFVDKDVEELTKWWPTLEILDFSISACGERKGNADQETQTPPWTPSPTVGCLGAIAKGWPHLKHLSLPVNLASEYAHAQDLPIHTRLREFKTVTSSLTEFTPLMDANITFIRNLFPSVRNDFTAFN